MKTAHLEAGTRLAASGHIYLSPLELYGVKSQPGEAEDVLPREFQSAATVAVSRD